MSASRSYDNPCGIARALDVVGERWSLLVVRELVFTPKRFADLRRGLVSVSPNVLSQRLAELERDGVLEHRFAGPPVGARVYDLTPAGRALLPVLDALAGWGSRQPIRSDRALSRDGLMFALQTAVRPGAGDSAGLRVSLDGSSWDPVLTGGTLEWRPPTAAPAASLATSSAALHQLVFRGLELDEAQRTGQAVVSGERQLVLGFLDAFVAPTPREP